MSPFLNRFRFNLIFCVVLTLFLSGATASSLWARAQPTVGPVWFFTDNIAAAGPSPELTVMEAALIAQINNANQSIDLAIYDFNRSRARDALLAAHDRGVTVRVVTDDAARQHAVYKLYYDALADAGIPVVDDQRPGSIMHNKFFIFDQERIWTGSANITDNGFTVNHNNSLVFTSTLLADVYGYEFEQMFAGQFSGGKDSGPTSVVDYYGRPLHVYFSPQDNALDALLTAVNESQESITFSIFFFTQADLAAALISRHQAGVTIRGVWDRLGAASPYSQDETLCAAGIPIKIENFYGKMHNKFMVIDPYSESPRLIAGSMNWSAAGNDRNDENTIIFHDPAAAQSYDAFFWELYDALAADTLCDHTVHTIWLPLIVNAAAPTLPEPIIGDNLVCQQNGEVELCAWVSNGSPARYSTVTVYGRLRQNDAPQANVVMHTTWQYRTTVSYCEGVSDSSGQAACSRGIGAASAGYQVNITVRMDGHEATTWFTPQ